MVWVEIIRIEKSEFNNYTYLAFFELGGIEKFLIVSDKVCKYMNVKKVNVGDKIYVLKSYNRNKKPMFKAKMLKRDIE